MERRVVGDCANDVGGATDDPLLEKRISLCVPVLIFFSVNDGGGGGAFVVVAAPLLLAERRNRGGGDLGLLLLSRNEDNGGGGSILLGRLFVFRRSEMGMWCVGNRHETAIIKA